MLIIKTAEDRERCTSCYGNIIVELTMEEVVALFSGACLLYTSDAADEL